GKTLSLERGPSPLPNGSTEGLLTWFDYANKNNGDRTQEGDKMMPRYEAKRNPGGPWRIVYTDRNFLSKPTIRKDTFMDTSANVSWRTATFGYDINGIDLTHMTFGTETFSNVYNGFHEVVTNFNAWNETTTYAYNANNQVTSRVKP